MRRSVTLLLALLTPAPVGAIQSGVSGGAPVTTVGSRLDPGEKYVTFAGAGDLEIRGTLRVPDVVPRGGVPAFLLLSGAGPTDRDGDQYPLLVTDLLRHVADVFAKQGIATLRYDKRTIEAYMGELMELDPEGQQAFMGWDSYLGDARAAVSALRGVEEIDPDRIGVFGHSEGGLFALQLARESVTLNRPLSGMILASTSGRPLSDNLRYQVERSIESIPEVERLSYFAYLDQAIRAILSNAPIPDALPPGLRALFPPLCHDLFQVELVLKPTSLARYYPGPVLILHGANDIEVPARIHPQLLERAFTQRSLGTCDSLIAPYVSHNLKLLRDEKDLGFKGNVAPEIARAIRAWLATHFPARPE